MDAQVLGFFPGPGLWAFSPASRFQVCSGGIASLGSMEASHCKGFRSHQLLLLLLLSSPGGWFPQPSLQS